MLVIKLALRNLARHTKKTLLLGIIISAGTAFLFFANALFESTNQGLERSFVRSLTGDLVIGAGDGAFGLFGNEVPIVSSYESIPAITGFGDIRPTASANRAAAGLWQVADRHPAQFNTPR